MGKTRSRRSKDKAQAMAKLKRWIGKMELCASERRTRPRKVTPNMQKQRDKARKAGEEWRALKAAGAIPKGTNFMIWARDNRKLK